MPVRVSVTFDWDVGEGSRLVKAWSTYYDDVQIGGPAFGDAGGEFEPGRFLKPGATITSRGCPRRCPWCSVWGREGQMHELKIRAGWIVQDNNLLACTRRHVEAVFDMLRGQGRAVSFNGGLDARLLQDWHRDLLNTMRIGELWFACDHDGMLSVLENAARICTGIPQEKMRCYVMIGWNGETLGYAQRRLERVYELGFLPFCQLYRGPGERIYGKDWKDLNRKWSRPAAYRTGRQHGKIHSI